MNLMSSTLLIEDTGVPFDELQAEQIAAFREAWAEAGWEREPRVSVSRSVMPIISDLDRRYFGEPRRRAATRSATSTARSRASGELHRRARRDRRGARRRTRPCRRPTRCC